MNTYAPQAAMPAFILRLSACAHKLADLLAAIAAASQKRRLRAMTRLELATLDEHALRDIGLCRSELGSCLAEARLEAEHTRLRIAILQGGGTR